MCIAIENIVSLAKKTFKRKIASDGSKKRLIGDEEFLENLNEISEKMKDIHVDDLGLNQSPSLFPSKLVIKSSSNSEITVGEELSPGDHNENNTNISNVTCPNEKAPTTYISVYEDKDFSISIFIIKGNARIPLHNHPKMNGLLQVIYGTLAVNCYNKIPLAELTQTQLPDVLQKKPHLLERGLIVPTEHVVVQETKDRNSGPLILGPDRENYHEIWNTGDTPVAFLDILAPPYTHAPCKHTEGPELPPEERVIHNDERHCDFYKIARPIQPNCFQRERAGPDLEKKYYWLQVIPPPPDYVCDFEPYLGPPLVLPYSE